MTSSTACAASDPPPSRPQPADAVDAGALFAQIVAHQRDAGQRRARRFPRRRLALVLLAALAIAAPLAIAARTTHMLDFALGDPAPTPVVEFLDGMLPPDYAPNEGPPQRGPTQKDIIRGSEQVVAEMTTASGARARMYAVKVRTGGFCFAALGGPFNGGACLPAPAKWHYPVVAGAMMWGTGAPGTFAKTPVLYGRLTKTGAASLVVRYADQASDVIPTTRGWFLYEVPKVHQFWHHEPLRLDVLDASGRVIGTLKDPFGLHPPKRPKAEQPRPEHQVLARESLDWKDGSLVLQGARGDQGHRCVLFANTLTHNTGGWMCGAAVAQTAPVSEGQTTAPPPVYFELHQLVRGATPGGYVYARGWVGPPVASLEIRFQDSTVAPIPLYDRLFIYVVPSSHWALGKRPSYVIGRDSSGHAIFRRFLYPAAPCAYPLGEKSCAGRFITNG